MMRRIPVFFAVLLVVLSVGTASGQELRRTVFPQLGIGGGWSCDFFINNQGTAAVTGVKLSFFGDAGAALVVQTTDMGSASSFQFNIAAGETKVIRASGGAATFAGYAELIAPKFSTIRGTMVVRVAAGGKTSTQLGVSELYPFSHFSFAAEVNKSADVNTGIALVNPTLSFATTLPVDVIITLFNAAGTAQATKVMTLTAGQHLSDFLDGASMFPGLDNFVGTVSVSGPDYFGVLALRYEQGALGTVSVNEGAVIAPFLVNQQAAAEVEPNDATTSASNIATVPALVSGVISTKDDIDYFKFTGKKGDILRVLVELPANSLLDSEVFLVDSADNIIALNDQNGLGGPISTETYVAEWGSFMVAILPADGTYYLKLWDFLGEFGGSEYTYRMHVTKTAPSSAQ